ncbi:alpha-ketoglutarate-dependent dioxygenase AlkB [Phragmitibacter flavus]|uniref:Alpha-ketoglutarate-dependent dioxygenase AlkB n=1 Tax=Phragmitibacter flavus TaxID=2576071 RepID=A0A5R8KK72_9BACT|nr:alpha-ketoglutarate-dependent dioxygenase AlkB [Phragmitibacter flavus]TLD72345.1 alpha-ketoglutarate-dependent dioxygenase AlkB [Phragmitibacter flavus]
MSGDLFGAADYSVNLLPSDGEVNYHGPIFGVDECGRLFEKLLAEVAWRHDEAVMFGKRIVTARKVAWYGNEGFKYTYSGTTKEALPWSDTLREIKAKVETLSGAKFNSCLLNLYHHGEEGMGWHSDDEKELARDAAIASVSLGAARKFCFKHKQSGERVDVGLENGSLLVMLGATQRYWLHRLPPSKRVKGARINLTFRLMA